MTPVVGTIDWQGITLSVGYEPHWLGKPNLAAHLEIHVIAPEGALLPITNTGYRSHFTRCEEIEAAGGPLEFVRTWLDDAARSPEWRRHCEAARQLSLF
jgi:hypothetical protein